MLLTRASFALNSKQSSRFMFHSICRYGSIDLTRMPNATVGCSVETQTLLKIGSLSRTVCMNGMKRKQVFQAMSLVGFPGGGVEHAHACIHVYFRIEVYNSDMHTFNG